MNFSIAAYSRSCDFLDCAGKASTRKMKSFAVKVSSSSRFHRQESTSSATSDVEAEALISPSFGLLRVYGYGGGLNSSEISNQRKKNLWVQSVASQVII